MHTCTAVSISLGSSTSLCTGIVKNVVSRYIHNGSAVLGCFVDASKAFDMVDYGIFFQKLTSTIS